MERVKVGVNGFGRIGKLTFTAALENPEVQVVAINDPFMDLPYMKYLLTHDTIHGGYKGEVEVDLEGGYLIVAGQKV